MINADDLHEAEQQALGQLAERDLALALRLHDLAMAAEDPREIADHVRSYQRASRCVRQTIMLRARLRRDHERHVIATTPQGRDSDPDDLEGAHVVGRIIDLQEAAHRIVAQAEAPGTPRAERAEALDRIDAWIDDEIEREGDDFGRQPLADHVLALCRACGLPEALGGRFQDLPRVPHADEDDAYDRLADTG